MSSDGGYLLVSHLHKQAFASATKHQLLAFLQVAAFTNRTAVLPMARVGEPAFVGFPDPAFSPLDRYFDTPALLRRWPCLRAISYDQFVNEHGRVDVALQLGLPRGVSASPDGFVENCGKRTRQLVGTRVRACLNLTTASSAAATLGAQRFRKAAVMITNWSQKIVGLGDAFSSLFGDAFAHRGGCHDSNSGNPRDFPPLAKRWIDTAKTFTRTKPDFACVHLRAEKLASSATGPEKRKQWIQDGDVWTSPYMEKCLKSAASIVRAKVGTQPIFLITDTDTSHGTPSNQGSAHFKEWRERGESLARRDLFPSSLAFCSREVKEKDRNSPECAIAEAAICRQARHVFRFGTGTFSEFVVGDPPDAPPSTQYLDCASINTAASLA